MHAAATDVLERLERCAIRGAPELVEGDLTGGGLRPCFLVACRDLCGGIRLVAQSLPGIGAEVSNLATEVIESAKSEGSASSGRLDARLRALAEKLDPGGGAGRLAAVEALVAFLQAGRMRQTAAGRVGGSSQVEGGVDREEEGCVEVSGCLRRLAVTAKVDVAGGSAEALVATVASRVEGFLSRLPEEHFSSAIGREELSEAQLGLVGDIHAAMAAEYGLRRRMLIERAGVTLQSFLWSARLREKCTEAEAEEIVRNAKLGMDPEPSVSLADLFDARLADVASVSARAGGSNCGASVKGVIIGRVPDRGGRAEGREGEALRGMPGFQKRQGGGWDDGGGRGRRKKHRK
ncbi:unnamed protein product [Ostreobium quekettii]|uniref:Uncharacterized protein n=1 Tax=Ostreobium quekettii TaxID=121088 RepID=A0A8S1J7B9_9CHLO|nr:unnamed protein product [Ostreobium quekettii]